MGILTVGVVTKPFHFEGVRRMQVAETGIQELAQGRRHLAHHRTRTCSGWRTKTTFADTFAMADQVLLFRHRCVTDLMVKKA